MNYQVAFMIFKKKLLRIHFFLAEQLGIDLGKLLLSSKGLVAYILDLYKFKREYNGALAINPCLGDRYKKAGEVRSEYFWQDLLVARKIFKARPEKHVDIGSRIDGFVAHIASFRDIEVFDIRRVDVSIPGVLFRQADVMSDNFLSIDPSVKAGYCDSLSCLHAIEHFGLGRYGDRINPDGYLRGLKNLCKLLQKGGSLYLSTPIGKQRVEFNANWVFDPLSIVNAALAGGLVLDELIVLDQRGGGKTIHKPMASDFRCLAAEVYRLGIFCFTKAESQISER
jgi:hypothetical protein